MKRLSKIKASVAGALYLAIEAASLFIIIKILNLQQSSASTSIWIYFTSMIPLAQLAISGYSPLITREVAKSTQTGTLNPEINENIKKETSRLFKNSFFFIFSSMMAAIVYLHSKSEDQYTTAFVIYFFSVFARAYLIYIFSYFIGLKQYGLDKIIMLFCTIWAIAMVYVSSKIFNDLTLLAWSYTLPYLIGAAASKKILNKKVNWKAEPNKDKKIFKRNEIYKMYLINAAGFLTLNTDVIIAKANFNSANFLEYGLLSKAIMGISAISGIIISLQLSSYSTLFATTNEAALKSKIKKTSIIISALTTTIGGALLLTYDQFIQLILYRKPELDNHIIIILILFLLAAVNTMNIGTAIIAKGDSKLANTALPIACMGFAASLSGALTHQALGMVSAMALFGLISLALHLRLLKKILEN